MYAYDLLVIKAAKSTVTDEEMVLQVPLLDELLAMDGYWEMESQFA